MVQANIWSISVFVVTEYRLTTLNLMNRKITQDPSVYPNPTMFDPTRFINTSENGQPQPLADYVFGWGRR